MRLKRNAGMYAAMFALATTPAFAQSQTAQSAMVKVDLDDTAYQIEETITWTFQRGTHREPGTAMYAYTNDLASGPVVTCSGSSANCASTNQPATPPAPGADEIKLQQHAQAERCTFFSGGTLTVGTYDQSVTLNNGGLNGKGNWTFTWSYAITPTSFVVGPYTAWTSEVTGGTVDVGYSGFLASESFLKQATRNKYSFTMIEGGVTRARNVTATLQLFDGTAWQNVPGATADLNNVDTDLDTVNDGLDIVPAAADFSYFANGGWFGNSAVFNALHAVPGKAANGVDNILKGVADGSPADNFAGNNNDLAAGNVHTGPFSSSFAGVSGEGSYRVNIAGVLKGNSSSSDFGFSVASNQTIVGGCPIIP